MRGVKVHGTIDADQHKWIIEQIESGKFYNASHVLKTAITALQNEINSGKIEIDKS